MKKDYKESIEQCVSRYEQLVYKFLRDLIAIPSTSCNEEKVVGRIVKEMKALGYDEVVVDPMGNVMGRMGSGAKVIAFDGHIDTVDVGELENWHVDPFEGSEDDTYIYGRGASDQEGGFVAAVYAGKVIKDLGLSKDYTLWVVGSVQEEDCDGLCWQYILDEGIIKPEVVVLTEPTALRIHRGHRGRMEIKVTVKGVSAHGSAPERGDNAIYKMASILQELEELNRHLTEDAFLGAGTLTVSEIFFSSPSRCAVADGCSVSVDRRLTWGESASMAIEEISNLPSVVRSKASVEMYSYKRASYKGLEKEVPCYFPTWVIDENHIACTGMVQAYNHFFDHSPVVDKWTFSTNGVAIMGIHDIPCIGFGPGKEEEAHAPNEKIEKRQLLDAIKVYALMPTMYMEEVRDER